MDEAAIDHANGFIDQFIDKRRRGGWRTAQVTKPSKADRYLSKFEKHLNADRCVLVDDPIALLKSTPQDVCMYWNGIGAPVFVTAAQAADLWESDTSDAIVSFFPGQKLVFLFHEGWGWSCSEPR